MTRTLVALALLSVAGAAVAQSTTEPERDARGIPVVSAPAAAPAGANQPVTVPAGATVTVNPNQAAVFTPQAATGEFPPCTREITDRCTQTYERRRR